LEEFFGQNDYNVQLGLLSKPSFKENVHYREICMKRPKTFECKKKLERKVYTFFYKSWFVYQTRLSTIHFEGDSNLDGYLGLVPFYCCKSDENFPASVIFVTSCSKKNISGAF
jgi:hypothetical protein